MKKILFTLCLAAALTVARGQIYIDSYRFGAPAPAAQLFLDQYPSAEVAFSIRKMDKDYNGDCVVVRRSNDNALDTIGFVNDYLDTATMKTFCGANNCFVRVWYDQSGNGRNATMTTDANQPQIIASGALIKQGAKVALKWDGVNDRLNFAEISLTAATHFIITKRDSLPQYQNYLDIGNPSAAPSMYIAIMHNDVNYGRMLVAASPNNTRGGATGININNVPVPLTTYRIYAGTWSGAGTNGAQFYRIWDNNFEWTPLYNSGIIGAGSSTTSSLSGISGTLQEVILYNADKSSDMSAMNGAINTFYSIY
jgi:hypothetical protein